MTDVRRSGVPDLRAAFVITGMQAAGKSTVADLLARRFKRGVHVPGDSIRSMVVRGREDMTALVSAEARRQLLLRYDASLAVACRYRDAGFTVVVEDVIIGEMLEQFLALVPWPKFHLVVLNPDRQEIMLREQGRNKLAYGRNWSIDGLAQVLADTPRKGFWLNSTGQSAQQTVDSILANLDSSRMHGPHG